MGLIRDEQIGSLRLALWETTESEAELLEVWKTATSGLVMPESYTHPHRRRQWLASRVLLHHIHPDEQMSYDEHGKPWLSVPGRHISLSHTSSIIALLSSPEHCGIDIELISPKVERIANKFLKPGEVDAAMRSVNPETLYVYWCAKEALYKVYGRKGVSLKDNITVNPFIYSANGELTAVLQHENIIFEKTIRYEHCSSYMMAYTLPAPDAT
jgi:4'-phosphopantetheinyl transferase